MKFLAQCVSAIFQPLLMPGFALVLLFSVQDYFSNIYVLDFIYRLYLVALILTIILPFLSLLLLYRWGIISDITLSKRKDRVLPTYVSIVYYCCFYYILREIPGLSPLILSAYFGSIVAIFIANWITIFWKISIHAIGISITAGVFVAITELTFTSHTLLISLLLFSIGLVCWSRLYLNKHTPLQLIAGSLLGFIIPYSFILLRWFV